MMATFGKGEYLIAPVHFSVLTSPFLIGDFLGNRGLPHIGGPAGVKTTRSKGLMSARELRCSNQNGLKRLFSDVAWCMLKLITPFRMFSHHFLMTTNILSSMLS